MDHYFIPHPDKVVPLPSDPLRDVPATGVRIRKAYRHYYERRAREGAGEIVTAAQRDKRLKPLAKIKSKPPQDKGLKPLADKGDGGKEG